MLLCSGSPRVNHLSPIRLLHYEVRGFLLLLAALLVYRALTGQLALNGLLSDPLKPQSVSPARVQLLLATLTICFQYLSQASHGNGTAMPNISPQWLLVFGASSGIYAAVKASKFWTNNSKST